MSKRDGQDKMDCLYHSMKHGKGDYSKAVNESYDPMKYGMGKMCYNMFGAPNTIGHSGSTGAFAYYIEKYDVYAVGTTNDFNEEGSIQKMLRMVMAFG